MCECMYEHVVNVCVCKSACVCVCVCVCERERESVRCAHTGQNRVKYIVSARGSNVFSSKHFPRSVSDSQLRWM